MESVRVTGGPCQHCASAIAARRGATFAMLSILAGLALAATVLSAGAQNDFYKDKSINVVVSYPPGDGNDVYARLLTRHWSRYIPGNPQFVVMNRPGASGLVGANYLYTVAPRDGLTIGVVSRSVAIQSLTKNPGVRFDYSKFSWIGTTSSYENDAYCLYVRSATGIGSIQDLQRSTRPILFGTSATPGDSFFDIPQISRKLFKLNIKLVKGYSSPETLIAMERGEIDGRGLGVQLMRQFRPEWIDKGEVRCLIQYGHKERWSELPDVPTAQELAANTEDRQLVSLMELPLLMARPWAGPPDVPQERIAVLRRTFMLALRDPNFQADAQKLHLDISPKDGAFVDELLAKVAVVPLKTLRSYTSMLTR